MTVFAGLQITGLGTHDAARELLKRILGSGLVDGVIVPIETHDRRSVQLALVRDPEKLRHAQPLAPVVPVSAARIASLLTERSGAPEGEGRRKTAVVMKPCELRAAVELAKLRQVRLDGLLTVAVDCAGTYEPRVVRTGEMPLEALREAVIVAAREGRPDPEVGPPLRHACTICIHPVAPKADVALHLVGMKEEAGILVELGDEKWAEALGLTVGADPRPHQQAVEALVTARQGRRKVVLDKVVGEMSARPDGTPGLVELFDQCQRCLNCSIACPICYCKECLFRTETLRPEPRRFQALAGSRGSTRMPGDAIAFQLTRLNHVSTSCVGCGLCTSACPADLPVDAVFQAVAMHTQGLFDYVPGRAVEEALPATTFKRDEFVTLGED